MTDGWRAALSTMLVFFAVVSIGPAYTWLKEKIRSSEGTDKRFKNYSNYIIPQKGEDVK